MSHPLSYLKFTWEENPIDFGKYVVEIALIAVGKDGDDLGA
jgi:hypothetical protein